jgi:membrane associated rhomboid family serine protease
LLLVPAIELVHMINSMMEPMPDNVTDLVHIVVGSEEDLNTLSLVLSAVGIDHRLDPSSGHLLVTAETARAAQFQLDQYRLENRDWPPPLPVYRRDPTQIYPTLMALSLLAFFYGHTGPWTLANPWFIHGAVDSVAILERGEWWRLLTALTLHADMTHLLGNILLGGLVVHLLSETIGYGLAWTLLILSGTVGNLCNIVLRQQAHLSVGFSTAVFAAIGILAGLQLGRATPRSFRTVLIPLGSGAALLAMLGSEGIRTDLGAHFFGCMIGLAAGWLVGFSRSLIRWQSPSRQLPLFLMALLLFPLAWFLAHP